jgi:hypothetical protein
MTPARPTPQVVVEAILLCVRESGLGALDESTNIERLRCCDEAAPTLVNQRIAKLKGDSHAWYDYAGEALRRANGGRTSGTSPEEGDRCRYCGEAITSAEMLRGHRCKQATTRTDHLISRCAADIEPKRIEFLWAGRIARGKHTAIAGEAGTGKSQISVYVAARISCGAEWPCGEGRAPLGNVIILNAEDGADDTVVPRLMAAGADLNRVHIVSAVQQKDGKGRRTFNLQADLALLERTIAEIGEVALVIIDPISSYMGKIDSHKNSEVRGALEPLSEMAARLSVAILSITHFSKAGYGINTKALHRFIGSIAFVGAPRAAFAVIEDTDNEGRMLFLHAKNNIAGKPQGLAYRLEQTQVDDPAGRPIVASYVVWDDEPVGMTADEALRASENRDDRSSAAEAEEFLRSRLADGAEVSAKEAEEYATNALGITSITLRRARKKLGVVVRRQSDGFGGKGQWVWSLPPPQGAQNPTRRSA